MRFLWVAVFARRVKLDTVGVYSRGLFKKGKDTYKDYGGIRGAMLWFREEFF